MVGKTLVVKLDMADERLKRKVMKTVSNVAGIKSINAEPDKLTVVCESADPIKVVTKLRKHCFVDILSIAPIKDEKKEAEKKKEEDKKKEEEKKKKELLEKQMAQLAYLQHYPSPYPTHVYPVHYSMDENPNACVIC